MPATYTLIASTILNSNNGTITFDNIPSTYTDLLLKFSARGTRTELTDGVSLTFNGTTGSASTYSNTLLSATGTSVNTSRQSNDNDIGTINMNAATSTSNSFANGEFYIPNYRSSVNKPLSGYANSAMNDATNTQLRIVAGLWRDTDQITKITLTCNNQFVTNSSFWLYGIKKD